MKFSDAKKKASDMFQSKEFIERVKEEDSTMLIQLPLLAKINSGGFITVDSQAGRRTTGISFRNQKPYVMNERAYIMGFMSEKEAGKFIKELSLKTDKTAAYIPMCDNDIKRPSELDIPLTYTRQGTDDTIHTHTSLALPEVTWTSFRKQANINKNEPVVFLCCWDTQWNRLANSRGGLFTDILRVLY